MKIFKSNTNKTFELSDKALKCFTFNENMKATVKFLTPDLAFNCGLIVAESSRLVLTLYSLEYQRSESDKLFLKNTLEELSAILEGEITEEILKNIIEEGVEEFLNRDYINVIEYNNKGN